MCAFGRWVYASLAVGGAVVVSLDTLDKIRTATHNAVNNKYSNAVTDMMFTGDERWAKPMQNQFLLRFRRAMANELRHSSMRTR